MTKNKSYSLHRRRYAQISIKVFVDLCRNEWLWLDWWWSRDGNFQRQEESCILILRLFGLSSKNTNKPAPISRKDWGTLLMKARRRLQTTKYLKRPWKFRKGTWMRMCLRVSGRLSKNNMMKKVTRLWLRNRSGTTHSSNINIIFDVNPSMLAHQVLKYNNNEISKCLLWIHISSLAFR